MWKNLRHPNVLPLLGVTLGHTHFAMVSEWMVNGNINQFAKKKSRTNEYQLVGFHPHC